MDTILKIQKKVCGYPVYKRKNIVDNLIDKAYNNNH